jgi:predicted secreted protein
MTDPVVVYQLALRIGASYDATCRALERDNIIDSTIRDQLLAVPRKKIKQALLDGLELENWTSDVWILSEKDEGLIIEGQPDDVFVFRLTERSGAGYLWSIDGLRDAGFVVLRDRRELPPSEHAIGGPVTRALTARPPAPTSGDFSIELRRPWQKTGAPLSRLHVLYNMFGKEVGMPRALRRQLMAA